MNHFVFSSSYFLGLKLSLHPDFWKHNHIAIILQETKYLNPHNMLILLQEKIFSLNGSFNQDKSKTQNQNLSCSQWEGSSFLSTSFPWVCSQPQVVILQKWTSCRHLSWGPSLSTHMPWKLGILVFAQVLTPPVITNIAIAHRVSLSLNTQTL